MMEKVERIQYQAALAISGAYLKTKLPPNYRPLYSGNIRKTFHEITCKSNRYKNSFFPDAIASWNIFIKHFDGVPSFNILKDHTNGFFRPKPNSIFGVHDPLGLRYLFQLRVGLSPLRNHKWWHNFADIPSNICHCNLGIEDTSHFLFSCPAYANQRASLIISVNVILQEYNLYVLRNQFPI